jgi:hypothetical protein
MPASDAGIIIAFYLSHARSINQLDPFALMKEDVLLHTQFMKLGLSYAFLASAERGELPPPPQRK